jgi:hypothetical protein
MEIAIVTSLLAKGYMNINSAQAGWDLMNNFIFN